MPTFPNTLMLNGQNFLWSGFAVGTYLPQLFSSRNWLQAPLTSSNLFQHSFFWDFISSILWLWNHLRGVEKSRPHIISRLWISKDVFLNCSLKFLKSNFLFALTVLQWLTMGLQVIQGLQIYKTDLKKWVK